MKPNHPFFTPDVASQILLKLEQASPQAEPIPNPTDMQMSPALSRTLDAALALSKELGHKQVDPLHLLAAALSDPSTQASEVLKEAGVTREAVIAAIKATESSDHA